MAKVKVSKARSQRGGKPKKVGSKNTLKKALDKWGKKYGPK